MFVKQRYNWDCGAAAFANSYYMHTGKHISLKKARLICQSTSTEGTSDISIVEALKGIGFAETRRMGPHNQRYAFSYLTRGDIACIDRWSHWVVVVEKFKRTIVIHDPEIGFVELTKKQFKDRWKFEGTYFWISVK